jgi:vitamin B12 transporter
VFLRGTESDHTKVYIDGIDVSDPSSGGRTFDFGQLLTSDIDRIEVLRGPQSGLYGADALGGVIVIYTKTGEGPPQATGMIEGGSFGTFNQSASLSGSTNKFDYAFNVAHYRADSIPVTPPEILLPGTRAFDNSYDNLTLSTKLGYAVTSNLKLNGVLRYTQSDLDLTTDSFDLATETSRPNNYQSDQSNEQLFTRGEAVWTGWGGAVQSFVGVNYSFTGLDLVDPGNPLNSSLSDGDRIKSDWRTIFNVAPGWALTTGADYQNETLATNGVNAEEWNGGVYSQLTGELIRNLYLAGNLRYDENENFGSVTTWRFAPAFVIETSGTTLKGSVGKAFKAPSLFDRFVDFPAFGFFANPDLKPEENIGYDLGFEQDLNQARIRFGATYFNNDLTNLIEFVSDPETFTSTVLNVGKARTSGVEAFVAANISNDIRLRADYTFTDAINEVTGEALPRRARNKVTVTAEWTPIEPLLLTAIVNYVGESPDFDRVTFEDVTLPYYTVVNIAADYKIDDHVSLIGRIDNLFDADYEVPDGFEAPGFGAYAGVRLRN